MFIIYIIIAIIILMGGIVAFDSSRSKNSIERFLNSSYGNVHENLEERYERIDEAARLYIHDTKDVPETDLIDDITWDDLGMDEIFVSADHTDSFAGAQYLYSVMRRLDADEKALAEHDRRADFFDKNDEKRMKVRKAIYSIGQSYSGFRLVENLEEIGSKHLKYRRIFPLLGLLLLIIAAAAVITRDPIVMFIAIILLTVNLIVHTFAKNSVDKSLQTIFNAAAVVSTAKQISEEVPEFSEDIKPDIGKMSVMLNRSRYLILEKNAEITKNTVMNLLFFILNIFMTDLFFYDILIDEIERRKAEMLRLYRFTGSIDYDISLASYRRYIGDHCIPEFTDQPEMRLKGVCHPMIKDAVRNDFSYSRSTIITGSNASGKSTFIKSVALALILGQTLHTCHAESAVMPRCGVMTSMAVRDDIHSGESYYIREIRYLKRMVELCKNGKLLFLAVDEILRGTNTRERIAASKAVMEYFSKQNCMFIVATHDMELAEYFRDRCENCHFSESVGDGDVVFDYKLHEGISTTSNAIRLLGAMGFPDTIVETAKKYTE